MNSAASRDSGSGDLLFIRDPKSKIKWLVDGGAILSILPPLPIQRKNGPNGTKLSAANGTSIPCYGTTRHSVTLGSKSYPFNFIIADVKQPIIGADFLAHYNLAPNHRDRCLIDLQNFETSGYFETIQADVAPDSEKTRINYISQKQDPFYQLLDNYPDLSTPSFRIKDPKHGVRHYIPTQCNPIQNRARKLAPDKLAVAKAEIEKLCQLGVCERGKSEWASPLMVAKKPCVSPCKCTPSTPCGGWRVCGDYRRLNTQTTDDKYPVRNLTDFNTDLAGKKIFSKIDLLKGYHQIPVADEDVKKTGVITPFGLFLFPRTPFGLKNAGQDFQRLMDEILGDVPHTFVYIDDILVASETPEEHLEDLKRVFDILDDNGMVVNRSKCVLGQTSLEFLGYRVDQHGVSPLPERVEAIRKQTPPTTIKELQRFLGMVNYYRRFIKRAAQHLYHLFDALKGKKEARPRKLEWTKECQTSFDAIKEALAKAAMLRHPRPNAKLALTADASKFAIGAVLEQRGPLGWEPLGFFSAKLEGKQPDWPPFDRELLAAFRAIRHFRHMVEGRTFTLYTDHDSLVPALRKKSEPHTARQTYQLSCIAEFTTDIQYLEGKANVVADQLSRPNDESPSTETPVPEEKADELLDVVASINNYGIDLQQMAQDQPLDQDFQRISREARTGLNFKKVDIGQQNIIVDVSNGPARPFVPQAWRKRIFDTIHNLGHPGVQRTVQAVSAKFVWPNMRADVANWARQCLNCQRAKVLKNVVPPIGRFEVPNRRFSHIHVDIVSLPPSNGYSNLLTVTDRFTRWPAAIPIPDISAESVVDALAHGWIASYGVPKAITTDRGSQFSSAIWRQLLQVWGIENHQTAAYHPEANGLVERLHRRMKESLIALCEDARDQWYWRLPMVLLAIRTTFKPDVGASPADLVYGEGLAIPGEILGNEQLDDPELLRRQQNLLAHMRMEVERLQPQPTSAHRRPAVHLPGELEDATHVFIRRGGVQPSMTSPYEGPFRVIDRNDQNFDVQIPGRGTETIALARIKPAHLASNDDEDVPSDQTPPSPPPPGRRPGPRTRQPPPTDRVTRQQTRNPVTNPDPLSHDPGEGTSAQARARNPSISEDSEDDYLSRLRRLRDPDDNSSDEDSQQDPPRSPPPVAIPVPPAPVGPHVPDPHDGHTPPNENLAACPCDPPAGPCAPDTLRFTQRRQRTFSNRGGPVPQFPDNNEQSLPQPESPNIGQRPIPQRFFSKPNPGNFSHRRRRPDVNALFNLIHDHLSS